MSSHTQPAAGRLALSATIHCLTGCAIGEVLGMVIGTALQWPNGATLAADTLSITIMEIVDNAIMLVVPGAMDAGLATWLFWGTLAGSLVIAGVAAYPANRWLIRRGRGHALVHEHHRASDHPHSR